MVGGRGSSKKAASRKVVRGSSGKTGRSGKSTAAKKIELPFRHGNYFRYVPATGALVRGGPDQITLTFYIDHMAPISQSGELIEEADGARIYRSGGLTEEMTKLLEVAVQMPIAAALSLATLVLKKVHELSPEMVEKAGFLDLSSEENSNE